MISVCNCCPVEANSYRSIVFLDQDLRFPRESRPNCGAADPLERSETGISILLIHGSFQEFVPCRRVGSEKWAVNLLGRMLCRELRGFLNIMDYVKKKSNFYSTTR